MRRFPSIVAIALLVLAGLALTSLGPAAAGGPTSALLSVPGEGKTASLYYTDPDYVALAGLVGSGTGNGVGTVDTSGMRHENGPGVTVTWLIHDVTPWRVDHIYLEGKGAPWIATQLAVGGGADLDSPVVWHQPRWGSELAALLDKLGVGTAARNAKASFTGVAGAPMPAPAEPVAEKAATVERSATPGSAAGLAWGVGGLIAGMLITALWMRSRENRAEDTGSPAAVLDDAGDKSLAASDELSHRAPRV